MVVNNDIDYFNNAFEKQMAWIKRDSNSNIGYGDNVMPILKMYKDLSTFEERNSFRETLATFLKDKDDAKRNFAIDVCLGFLVFRDSI